MKSFSVELSVPVEPGAKCPRHFEELLWQCCGGDHLISDNFTGPMALRCWCHSLALSISFCPPILWVPHQSMQTGSQTEGLSSHPFENALSLSMLLVLAHNHHCCHCCSCCYPLNSNLWQKMTNSKCYQSYLFPCCKSAGCNCDGHIVTCEWQFIPFC